MFASRQSAALKAYNEVGVRSGVDDADPHRLIQMLMQGALDRMASARGHLERGEVAQKGEQIGRVLGILEGLRACLDPAPSAELAERLEQLYDYMGRRVVEANLHNDPTPLDEAASLMREIKLGWDGIPVSARAAQGATTDGSGETVVRG